MAGCILRVFKLVFAGLVLLAIGVFLFVNAGFTPRGGPPKTVNIPDGMLAGEVARHLEKEGIIKSALAFRLMMKMSQAENKIKHGQYLLNPSESAHQILGHLIKGDSLRRFLTFNEGWTAERYAQRLQQEGVCTADQFLKVVRTPPPGLTSVTKGSLEGFLYPDTYEIPPKATAEDVVRLMVRRFDDKVIPVWQSSLGKQPRRMTLRECIILASLVEAEAQVYSERPIIASVYYNRLKKNMPLQCDATIQYILGHRDVVSYEDLKVDNPYNTYLYKGLPPGPIGNPGLACIQAAMQPEKSEYLFYVRNDKLDNGSHVFTRTYEEHEAAIRQYQKAQ